MGLGGLGSDECHGSLFVLGTVMIMPKEESVQGVARFDSVFHEYYTSLAEPITLKLQPLYR